MGVHQLISGRPVPSLDAIKLAATVTAAHGAGIVLRKPTYKMMGVSAMLARHAPSKPFSEGDRAR